MDDGFISVEGLVSNRANYPPQAFTEDGPVVRHHMLIGFRDGEMVDDPPFDEFLLAGDHSFAFTYLNS